MKETSLNFSARIGVLGFFALGLWFSSISAAQELRYVDPAFDIQNLPASGTALSAGGTDAQIIRFPYSLLAYNALSILLAGGETIFG